MIISPAQLKAINEAASQMFQSDVSTLGTDVANAFSQTPNAQSVTMSLPGTGTGIATCTRKDAEQNGSNVLNNLPNKDSIGQLNITNDTVEESRYSKRQVELGRMLEMRRTGKVYSKKQLNEMFMETQDNVNRLEAGLGDCFIVKIFEAVASVFGPEVENEMKERISNGEAPTMTIKDIFSREDSEKQEKFLNTLGI